MGMNYSLKSYKWGGEFITMSTNYDNGAPFVNGLHFAF